MKYQSQCWSWRPILVTAGILGGSATGWADPPYGGTPSPVNPQVGPGVPLPTQVPGKEYSNLPNHDYTHAADPGQTMMWDGLGGVKDGVDFIPPVNVSDSVDAIANQGDALFQALWNNQAHLVYSVTRDGTTANNRERLWVEKWNQAAPVVNSVWARTTDVNHDLEDLNGIEVWGPDDSPDSTHCSIVGDPAGISVYHVSGAPYVTRAAVAIAIGHPELEDLLDLDALMVWDVTNPEEFEIGDEMIFSIAPASLAGLDGGEIYTWTMGQPAQFLRHGGHLWDTAFDVQGNTLNGGSENVDAIEAIAVPEPAAWGCVAGLLCAGAAFLARRRATA